MLHIVIGPMFSGKTTFLSKIFDYSKSIYINHTFDTRGEIFYSHDPSILIKNGIKTDTLKDEYILDYDIIAIDESQFFTNIKETIIRWVEKYEKTVYVAGLHGDYKREPFGEILDLIPYCDTINYLSATCSCSKPAHFTKRIINNDNKILIGTNEYKPVCRQCYKSEK
jgi:thymidine kinase